jgi:hypothetical protein
MSRSGLAGLLIRAFSLDGQAVTAHRLVLRVVRDTLVQRGRLAAVCRAAAAVLDTHARALEGSLDRLAVRDLPEQVTALWQAAADLARGPGELEAVLLRLRGWALYYLNELGDSAAQAIAVGAPLLQDAERVLGPDHPRHPELAEQPRQRLPGRGPDRRGDRAARAHPGRPRADPGL